MHDAELLDEPLDSKLCQHRVQITNGGEEALDWRGDGFNR